MKTPLEHIRGAEHRKGDPAEAERLADIFRIEGEDEAKEAVQGVHGLHPYPGRMHPLWARRILETMPKETSILDPFCGGGTVLVEARKLGLHARGSDINPIAVRLARLKCIPHADPDLVRTEAGRCVEKCTERRKTPFSALAGDEDSQCFPRHVLAGLISLRDEIEKTRDIKTRELLLFCMSPLLDKLASRAGVAPPRVSRTAVRDLFERRVLRWLAIWEELDAFRWAEVEGADARWLPWKPGSASAVVTSPPYPGVLDYADVQTRRMRWLGGMEEIRRMKTQEIGRRHTRALWTEDMSRVLAQLCRATKPGSPMYLLVGDGVMQDRVLRMDVELKIICNNLPLETVAIASQERPHFHRKTADAFRDRPRMEHLALLRRTDDPIREGLSKRG